MRTLGKFGALASLICFISASSRADLPAVVGLREIVTVGTSNTDETVSGSVLIEGSVRKVGAGSFSVAEESLFSGSRTRWDVLSGTLAMTTDGSGVMALSDAPSDVLAQAAFWVDATTNVLYASADGTNSVTEWLDAREPDTAEPYQRVRAVSRTNFTNAVPEYRTAGAGPDGALPYVWCGGYHSGRWMAWVNPDGSDRHFSTIHQVFAVHGAHDSYGFIFGITLADAATYPFDFYKDDYASESGAEGAIWEQSANGYVATAVRTGRTFLNRRQVDGTAEPVIRGYQLLDTEVGCRPANAGNFFNCRNLYPGTNARVGGDRLCEALVFTNRLSETDRIRVEHYLWQKWFSRAPQLPGGFGLATGATASVETVTGITDEAVLQGDGVFVKQGAGTLRLPVDSDTPLNAFNGAIRLAGGVLDARCPAALEGVSGTRYDSTNFLLTCASAEAGTLVKTGSGELVLASVPDGAAVRVEQGVLRFAQPLAASWPGEMRGTIPNPTFEGLTAVQKVFANGETFGGWTATVVDANSVRLITDSQWYFSGSPLLPYPTPNGTAFLILKGVGHIQTTFELPVGGVYALSFLGSGRKNSDGHTFDIIIDGAIRAATVPTLASVWQQYRYQLPWLSAGTHTLLLKTVSAGDITSALDDFRLDLTDTAEYVNIVSNACFECVTGGNYAKTVTFTNAAGTDWTFSSGGGGGSVNVTCQGSLFPVFDAATPRIINGSSVCNLQDYGRRNLYVLSDGIASTTVRFPETGAYTLSLCVARTRLAGTDWSAASAVTVSIDGCVTQTLTTASDTFQTKTIGPFDAPADEPLTLQLSGTLGQCMMLVDDIRVKRAAQASLVKNGGFEDDSEEWTYVNDPAALADGKTLSERFAYSDFTFAYGTNVFEGAYRLKLCDTGAAYQTVTFNEAGTYRFVCHANSRAADSYGQNPVLVKVSDGAATNVIGWFTSYDRTFRRHAFLFEVPAAGDYTLALEGQTPYAGKVGGVFVNDRTTLIDSVSVEKVAVAETGPLIPAGTTVEVAAGARLALTFTGTRKVETVRYEGQTITGTISQATHPEFVLGTGALYSAPKGTLFLMQ